MRYKNITEAIFISRPNRFIAIVEIGGERVTVHVKNTGRCRELLTEGCRVFLERSDNPARKTPYDLVAVIKPTESGVLFINMDSSAPNDAVAEWLPLSGLFSPQATFRREVTHKSSRFDFYAQDGERRAFIEVKGVTLEDNGVAYFPDAPTERGVKHLCELAECVDEGYEAYVIFVIQMKGINKFRPNDITHPQFGKVLRAAHGKGVHVIAVDCVVSGNEMKIDGFVEAELNVKEEENDT